MAQTGFTPIQLYSTSTAAAAPAAGNLTNSTLGSELAINITDGKLFYKDNANAVQVIGWKTVPTTAGGTGLTTYTAGDLSYYASGTTFTKLAIGASTTILTSTGSAPQWSATSGITVGTATNLAGGLAGSVPYQTGAGATTFLGIGASGRYLSSTGSAPQWSAPAALTETDDTNVTMTLGGTPSTALLSSVSMTLGWTGTLAVSRGGTGTGTAFTAGSVLFAGASGVYTQDNANFFWDDANNRLGLGITSPGFTLHVVNNSTGIQSQIASSSSSGTSFSMVNTATNGRSFRIGCNYVVGNGEWSLYDDTAGATRIQVAASGGVSIGNTTDPGAANLSVSGTVTAGLVGRQATYTNGSTTPSVTGCSFIGISNSSATTITNFTGGVTGQILTCYFVDSNTTVNRSNAYLNGGNNFVSTSNDTLVLLHVSGFWYEISRSNNS